MSSRNWTCTDLSPQRSQISRPKGNGQEVVDRGPTSISRRNCFARSYRKYEHNGWGFQEAIEGILVWSVGYLILITDISLENRGLGIKAACKCPTQFSTPTWSVHTVFWENGTFNTDQGTKEKDTCCTHNHAARRTKMSQESASSFGFHYWERCYRAQSTVSGTVIRYELVLISHVESHVRSVPVMSFYWVSLCLIVSSMIWHLNTVQPYWAVSSLKSKANKLQLWKSISRSISVSYRSRPDWLPKFLENPNSISQKTNTYSSLSLNWWKWSLIGVQAHRLLLYGERMHTNFV